MPDNAIHSTLQATSDANLAFRLIAVADDHLILGHRLSQWCGHAPLLEEDLAMPNIALDLIGQARSLYTYAGELEGKGRDEDALAYRRLEHEYTNLLMCEKANGDFAHTMIRQLFFSVYMSLYWQAAAASADVTIAAIAAKANKESDYHVRHTGQWVIRLGDGTIESSQRSQRALEQLTPYIKEFFETDKSLPTMAKDNLLPNVAELEDDWVTNITHILSQAKLELADYSLGHGGGRQGRHTEDMGYLLTELQFVQRSYPNLKW